MKTKIRIEKLNHNKIMGFIASKYPGRNAKKHQFPICQPLNPPPWLCAPHHQLPTLREEQLPGNIVLTDMDHEGVIVNNWFLI